MVIIMSCTAFGVLTSIDKKLRRQHGENELASSERMQFIESNKHLKLDYLIPDLHMVIKML